MKATTLLKRRSCAILTVRSGRKIEAFVPMVERVHGRRALTEGPGGVHLHGAGSASLPARARTRVSLRALRSTTDSEALLGLADGRGSEFSGLADTLSAACRNPGARD